jgi:ribosomal-protein-serine acetyltransferase
MLSLHVDDTLRLTLAEPRHAEQVTELIVRNQDRLARWLPWARQPATVDTTRGYIRSNLTAFAAGTAAYLLIEHDPDGIVGACGIRLDPAQRTGDLGYWLDAQAEGKGIVTRCVAALTRAGFEQYGLRRIEIRAVVGNERSRRVAQRCGYEFEGVLRAALNVGDHNEDMALYAAVAVTGTASGPAPRS